MLFRLSAIVLLTLVLGSATAARADAFVAHFIADDPPAPAPILNFQDAGGRDVSLADFKGRYVLLNLWATWCQPCAEEMPALDSLRSKFHDKPFAVIALTEDHDGLAAAQAFFQRHNLNDMPVFVDASGQAPALLHARGLPTTILIDPNGMEIGHVEGEADWGSPDAVAYLETQMK